MRRAACALVLLSISACAHDKGAAPSPTSARPGSALAMSAAGAATVGTGTAFAFDEASATPAPFAIGKADGSIELHRRGGIASFRAHAGRIVALGWHGGSLASAGADGFVRVWDAEAGRVRHELDSKRRASRGTPPVVGSPSRALSARGCTTQRPGHSGKCSGDVRPRRSRGEGTT